MCYHIATMNRTFRGGDRFCFQYLGSTSITPVTV